MKGQRVFSRLGTLGLVLVLLLSVPLSAFAAVWTDKPDYGPGEVVTISGDNRDGAGYLAGETVQVAVSGPNGYAETCEAEADEEGAWSCHVALWDGELAVGEYVYTAIGQSSGVTESGMFTDDPPHRVRFAASGLPNGASVSVTWSGTNPGGNPISGTTAFQSPGPSDQIDTKPMTSFYFTPTQSISVGGLVYELQSVSPTSPFTTGSSGATTAATATYELACTAPSITDQPQGADKTVGESVEFSVAASGTAPLSYQWRKGGTNIGGETASSYTISSVTLADAGSYTVVVSNTCGITTSNAAQLTVNKRAVTVTADAKSKTYGEADPDLTYQITSGSLLSGDSFTGALSRVAGENAGTYAIQQGTLALNDNYDLTFVGADLTIGARSIEVTADAKSKVYGEADPALTYRVTGGSLINGDGFSGALGREAGENVGSYAILQGTLTAGSNYAITYIGANLTITARSITVTADAKSKVYGDADPELTYEITGGSLVDGDSFSGALTRVAGEDVGTYAILQGTLTAGDNYAITFISADLTITKRPITVTADAKSKTYGEADPDLTYQITSGSLLSGDSFTGALSRVAGENVGTYAIQQGTLALNDNYDLTFVGANLTIGQRPIQVTADAQTKVYGESDPALTYQISGTLAFSDAFTGAVSRVAGEDVGSYAIQQGSLALSANYNLTFVGANLTITARPIEVTADAQSKVYGNADPALTYQITEGSLAFSDTFSGALTRVAGENVGSYAIQQGTLELSSNYTLTFVGANLTITTRSITVTADAKSKVYGDADPALTYQITAGSLAFSDAFTGALTREAGEDVGSYAIQQGSLALSANYDLTFVGADLTITPRSITVTADAKSKVYGDADPELTYQITGGSLVAGDGFSGAPSRVSGENVGTYAIQQGTLALNDNYDLTFVGANLTITKRQLTVTADDKEKILNAPNPPLTFSYAGFINGEDGSVIDTPPTCSTTAVLGSPVGTYPITCSGGEDNNYSFDYVPGTLRVIYATGGYCYAGPGHSILQPINSDDTSVFKKNSTVPAKFRVCDVGGDSIGTPGVVSSFKLVGVSNGTVGSELETPISTTPDTAFRWSATDQQWIFNLNSKNLTAGRTYSYEITLNDGTSIDFSFGLK